VAKNEAKIRFTAETGEFNSAIKKANSEMQELRAEMKLNEAQMKSTGATVEALENKHKILSNQLTASESKTEALAQKVDKAAAIFGENSDEVTKLRTQLLNAQAAEEKIKQAISACNAELDEQRNAMKQTESASKQLADTIDKQQNELSQLKGDYASAILEHGKYSKEARTLAKQIDSLSDELNENQKRMNEVEAAADKLDNSMDNLDETAEKVSEGFTVMKGAMADLLADGISKITDSLVEVGAGAFTMANDIEKATNTFITQTGFASDATGYYKDILLEIYNNNFGESFEDIAESMALVQTNIGNMADDDGLRRMTENALLLRDTFDFDVNESTRAASMLMTQFGVDGDTAFSMIASGAQYGLNKNGDLLDVINEYSVQFKDAGYSAEDMFNMLVAGSDTGTWSIDKLGDAVKEFNIRASDGTVGEAIKENAKAFGMTKTEAEALAAEVQSGSVEAYEKLRVKLAEVDDDTQRYQLGVAMFGTMWEDLGEETVMALMQTGGEIEATTEALEKINAVKYDDLGSAIDGIKRNLQTSVAEPIKNEVMPAVNEFVQDVDWDGVGQTIGEVMGVAIDAFFSFVDGVKQAVQWMKEHKTTCAVVATAIGVVAAAITAYNVVQGIKAAMDAAQVTTIWALVAAHAAQAAAAIAAVAPYVLIVAAITAVIAIIVLCIKHWDDIKAACSRAWESIKNATSKAWNSVKTSISNAWNSIKSSVSNAINNVKSKVQSVWNSVKSVTSSAWNAVKSTVSNVWNGIKSSVSNALSNVKSAISDKLNSAKSTVSNILGNIKDKFSSIFDSAKNIVKNAIEKIKGFFNFKWELPKIKLPHFSISGKFSLNPPSIPKFSVSWYKDGAIFTKPTLFNTPFGMKGVGEAGAEAVLPIEKLEDYISGAIERTQNAVNLNALASAIEDLASRPINLYANGRQIAVAMAGDSDSVNGFRSTLQGRGLTL
jgi:phage-related minor tail protein